MYLWHCSLSNPLKSLDPTSLYTNKIKNKKRANSCSHAAPSTITQRAASFFVTDSPMDCTNHTFQPRQNNDYASCRKTQKMLFFITVDSSNVSPIACLWFWDGPMHEFTALLLTQKVTKLRHLNFTLAFHLNVKRFLYKPYRFRAISPTLSSL